MDSERWRRIEEVFGAAMDLRPEGRATYLAEACSGDPSLEDEVRSLIAASETADDYFSHLASESGVSSGPPSSELPAGKRIGNYRIVELLGRGGMGAVYLAERDDDEFRMQVALKLLPLGLDTKEARERFRRERQILARLQHPNIARLFDGGVTEDGTPYLVMEHVEGTRIDEYCDAGLLDLRQRLLLFLDVCEAVDQAHRNLIVHRDLKPHNILVSKAGRVKLLDFGIAQALDREVGGPGTLNLAARPMTLAYASPEQIRGESVTTASDVYELGILLYRLLAGRHPYPVPSGSLGEMERIITEVDPAPPSSAVRSPAGSTGEESPSPEMIAGARNTTVTRLERQLAGDLDRMVLMALRKEPERRYPSARSFGEDVRRHLDGYPVVAQRDTLGYRLSRFVARNRAGVAVGAVLSLALLALTVTSAWFAVTTRAQSERIAREAETTEAVSEFLVDLFRVADPFEGLGDTLTVRTVLDRGAERLIGSSEIDPEIRAHMMDVVGEVYMALGLHLAAGDLFERVLEIHLEVDGPEHVHTAAAMETLGWSYQERSRYQDADSLFREVLRVREAMGGDSLGLAAAWAGIARALREQGEADSAKVLATRALEVFRQRLGNDDRRTVDLIGMVAFIQRAAGELDSAEALSREALEKYVAMGDNGARGAARTLNNLAFLLRAKGEFAEAEQLYRTALDDYAPWRTPPETQTLLGNLASVLWDQGKHPEVFEALSERLRLAREEWPQGHWRVGGAAVSLGDYFSRLGMPTDAEPYFRETLESYEGALGPDHNWTFNARSLLGACLAQQGRYRESEPLLVVSFEGLLTGAGAQNSFTASARQRLVDLYELWGNPEKAAQYRDSGKAGGS
jgi:serine/threonine protein kinase/tetratricopeptide (TPR) repeat protein